MLKRFDTAFRACEQSFDKLAQFSLPALKQQTGRLLRKGTMARLAAHPAQRLMKQERLHNERTSTQHERFTPVKINKLCLAPNLQQILQVSSNMPRELATSLPEFPQCGHMPKAELLWALSSSRTSENAACLICQASTTSSGLFAQEGYLVTILTVKTMRLPN